MLLSLCLCVPLQRQNANTPSSVFVCLCVCVGTFQLKTGDAEIFKVASVVQDQKLSGNREGGGTSRAMKEDSDAETWR